MRRIFLFCAMLLVGAGHAAACGYDQQKADKNWVYPNDSKAIKSRSVPMRFEPLPEGTMATRVIYKAPGLRTQAPDRNGIWEFRDALLLSFRGKQFAIWARAYMLSHDEKTGKDTYLGCLTEIVIYDEDGDGKFETISDRSGIPGPPFRIPAWVSSPSK